MNCSSISTLTYVYFIIHMVQAFTSPMQFERPNQLMFHVYSYPSKSCQKGFPNHLSRHQNQVYQAEKSKTWALNISKELNAQGDSSRRKVKDMAIDITEELKAQGDSYSEDYITLD